MVKQSANHTTIDLVHRLQSFFTDGEINFSDFLVMVTSYCFFEPTEILRCEMLLCACSESCAVSEHCRVLSAVCFYVFDQDKTGFFSVDDLNSLVNVVHNVKGGATVRGNVKLSWLKLTFGGDQIDFAEFSKISNAFPRLFEPAFRLQQQMMTCFMGEWWWACKKRLNQDVRDEADEKIRALERKREKRRQRKRDKKVQRSMGLLKYYLCPCLRRYHDPARTDYDELTDEQKAERDKQLAVARRQAELRIKNPETAPWIQYQKKVEETAVAEPEGPGYVAYKVGATERPREVRAESRAERRQQRRKDPDLKFKARTTVSGSDI